MDPIDGRRLGDELLNRKVGSWTVKSYVATGKSAVVLKAMRGDQVAALKVFDPELIRRCGKDVQEGRINLELSLRGKDHPGLVKVLDGGVCAERQVFFIAMEFLDYPNLSTCVSELPRGLLWQIIWQVAGAARFLESLQLAHRDIKPSNIVLDADFQRAVLLDFGILTRFGESELADGGKRGFIGTLRYSSPEFLAGEEQDTREGWRALTFYQLGAVLHDMIMRRPLFDESSEPLTRLAAAVKSELPHIEAQDVPRELVLLSKHCLTKDPSLRLRLVRWEDFEPHGSGAPAIRPIGCY